MHPTPLEGQPRIYGETNQAVERGIGIVRRHFGLDIPEPPIVGFRVVY